MMDKLSKYGPSIFSTMTGLAIKHNALNLAQGFPDFPTDPLLISSVDEAMKAGWNQYSRPIGAPILHEQITEIIQKKYGRNIDSDEMLTVYPGASFAIYIAVQALIHPGDEVIIFEPAYECYAPAIEIFGGVIKPVQLKLPDFAIDWNEVRSLFSSKTKMIIINNPHNPTATVWNENDFDELYKLTEDSACAILADEVYEFINYTERGHISLHSKSEFHDRSIIISSFGKSLHVTGWRMGYCIAPPQISMMMRKINQFSVFCTNHAMQIGVANYLKNHFNADSIKSEYQRKRDLIIKGLEGSRWKALHCDGTYFIMLDYSDISDKSSMEFTQELVTIKGIGTIPCSPFYSNGYDPKVVRICFAKKDETLNKAIELLWKI